MKVFRMQFLALLLVAVLKAAGLLSWSWLMVASPVIVGVGAVIAAWCIFWTALVAIAFALMVLRIRI
jgi:hypothetical protein